MKILPVLLYSSLFFLIVVLVNTRGLFIEEPVSQNISEGCYAIFNCTAYTTGVHWFVNGEVLDSTSNKNRGLVAQDTVIDSEKNLKITLLTVPGESMNNGITVTCLIFDTEFSSSNKALLLIQGLLDSVTNLSAVWMNFTALQVTFDPPTTLDEVPIWNYTIEIFKEDNEFREDNESSIVFTTTLTKHVINGLNSNYDFTLIVSAWNSVGQGNESSFFIDTNKDETEDENDDSKASMSSTQSSTVLTSHYKTIDPRTTVKSNSMINNDSSSVTTAVSFTSTDGVSNPLSESVPVTIKTVHKARGTDFVTPVIISSSVVFVVLLIFIVVLTISCFVRKHMKSTNIMSRDSWRLEFAMELHNKERTTNDYVTVHITQ